MSASSSPKPIFCLERKLLSDSFVEAARTIVRLHYAESDALIHGESLERFDEALELARRKREQVKQAYLLHIQTHGCGEGQLPETID